MSTPLAVHQLRFLLEGPKEQKNIKKNMLFVGAHCADTRTTKQTHKLSNSVKTAQLNDLRKRGKTDNVLVNKYSDLRIHVADNGGLS